MPPLYRPAGAWPRRRRYAPAVDTRDAAEIARRLAELRREHRTLDERIRQMEAGPCDELEARRLKKRKLQLKDCIARLESALIPDEPA